MKLQKHDGSTTLRLACLPDAQSAKCLRLGGTSPTPSAVTSAHLGEILGMMRRDEIAKLVGSDLKLRRAITRVPNTPIYDTLEGMYQHARATFETSKPSRCDSAVVDLSARNRAV